MAPGFAVAVQVFVFLDLLLQLNGNDIDCSVHVD
jgi:hypothetical protein